MVWNSNHIWLLVMSTQRVFLRLVPHSPRDNSAVGSRLLLAAFWQEGWHQISCWLIFYCRSPGGSWRSPDLSLGAPAALEVRYEWVIAHQWLQFTEFEKSQCLERLICRLIVFTDFVDESHLHHILLKQ